MFVHSIRIKSIGEADLSYAGRYLLFLRHFKNCLIYKTVSRNFVLYIRQNNYPPKKQLPSAATISTITARHNPPPGSRGAQGPP